jgi:hypothetical protein
MAWGDRSDGWTKEQPTVFAFPLQIVNILLNFCLTFGIALKISALVHQIFMVMAESTFAAETRWLISGSKPNVLGYLGLPQSRDLV